MEVYNEKVLYENPLLSLRVFRSQRDHNLHINWHYHRELELLLVLSGSLEVHVEEERFDLAEGDVAIIGASQLHRDRSSSGSLDYIVLQFDLEQFFDHSTMPYMRFFMETNHPLSQVNYIFQENSHVKNEIGQTVRDILAETTVKEIGYELAVGMLVKRILLLLLRNDKRKILSDQDDFDRLRLKPVLTFVEQHLTDRIQVEEVCKLANMSYYYFVKYFKKTIGLSFTEYVNYRKIKWAERILLTKDLSISEVGDRIGMPNMAHFYKMFKKYNDCSPKEFQKKMLAWGRS
ncbi:helix-turn-helix domain-containing protein [Paenibacillus pasadenensis]|uniref:Two-component response regulator yesN n=1 Tax=Paenibacillus pasadenensis TaxID=217090 RepID=A0A2N5N4G7_9BACL|nr:MULTISPECIES: AraC family transcriptional regulator [Paenibacillus]PLT45210.1 Two-component response regulator yesN [Paenibacillus pasadenensis]QGG55599.1 helix-turn-helix domain-containing protein [Paenibacillus sp. B01]